MFRQGHRDKEYKPGDPSELGDIFLPIASGKASEFNSDDESIEKSFDGTASTWYHSRWYGTVLPVKLEYTFETPQDVDYFVYNLEVQAIMVIGRSSTYMFPQRRKKIMKR